MSPGYYILGPDGRTPVPEPNPLAWAKWYETSGDARRVALTELPGGIGHISTVFLSLDYNFRASGRPVLFETMSFIGGEHEDYFDRYHTWKEAELGHAKIVAQAMAQIAQTDTLLKGGGVKP